MRVKTVAAAIFPPLFKVLSPDIEVWRFFWKGKKGNRYSLRPSAPFTGTVDKAITYARKQWPNLRGQIEIEEVTVHKEYHEALKNQEFRDVVAGRQHLYYFVYWRSDTKGPHGFLNFCGLAKAHSRALAESEALRRYGLISRRLTVLPCHPGDRDKGELDLLHRAASTPEVARLSLRVRRAK
jgi:hypothetical protein